MFMKMVVATLGCIGLAGCIMSPDGVVQNLERNTEALRGVNVCLLEYNSALVADGDDPCCRRENERNQCDMKMRCNDRSGGSCCIIYATANTQGGQGCCLYEGQQFGTTGSGNDREDECRRLLTE